MFVDFFKLIFDFVYKIFLVILDSKEGEWNWEFGKVLFEGLFLLFIFVVVVWFLF